ncbi:hypothetical protein [Kribbella sindirgiensis]|uniref:DUF1877 family protein n=1 Tax=Kribbella sindirgiensis TaxID=1124744 RepID=A0A4V2M2G3_9ACTN|nr:hypothetical protein [Kribbella sindirgiensis]TCC26155.1 hypothetical protein E0H50_32025 [Kribbella sindirgiensis]
MGVLFDYFAAASDEEAASVIDRVGGPGSPETMVAPPEGRQRGIFGRKRRAPEPAVSAAPDLVVYDTLSVKGIDPVVQLGTLEELLTGRPYDDVVDDPRSGHHLAMRDGGERLVFTLTDPLTAALAEASDETLERVAGPWSETEEFWNAADPSDLAEFLKELAGLAQRAQAGDQKLYCWVSV